MKKYIILIFFMSLSYFGLSAQLSTVKSIIIVSENPEYPGYVPKILPSSANPGVRWESIRERNNGRIAEYAIYFTKESLAIPLEVKLDDDLPNGYQFTPLEFQFPISQAGLDAKWILSPVKVDEQLLARETRELYGQEPGSLDSDRLFEYYQKAKAVSHLRVKKLDNNWSRLHDYDIQSVFKYLQATNVLSNRQYLVPPDDVSSVKDWLQNAINQNPERVEKALQSLDNAKDVIRKIEANEAYRVKNLWNLVLGVEDQYLKYQLFRAFNKLYSSLGSDTRRQLSQSNLAGLIEPEIVNSLAESFNKAINTDREKFSQPKNDQKFIIDLIDQVLLRTSTDEFIKKLRAAKIVITAYELE